MTTQLPDPAMHTFPDTPTPDELARRIAVTPDAHSQGLRDLAAAYESQRERIADLEEDVERLRPREPFVPEVLFSINMSGPRFCIETECRGGLTATMDHNDISHVLELRPANCVDRG